VIRIAGPTPGKIAPVTAKPAEQVAAERGGMLERRSRHER
jgi:hypothetical protein